MSTIGNKIRAFFYIKKHEDIEDEIREGFKEFAAILASGNSIKYNQLYKMTNVYVNRDLGAAGFHREYMSAFTMSLLAYLRTVREEVGDERMYGSILTFLNRWLDVQFEKNGSLYDNPELDIDRSY
jgi:hypothetical protein